MFVSMRPLLSTALLGLTVASGAALADHCGSYKSYGPHGHGTSPVAQYPNALPRTPYGYGTAQPVYMGQPGAGYAKTMSVAVTSDIVDVAASAGDFKALVAAIQTAGLLDTLKGKGPFTVFAPTDEAFAKIPKWQLDALLNDKDALVKVLTYHVVPAKVTAADVVKLSSAKTVEGRAITIETRDGVTVDNARVIKTDLMAANGVIHVIDTVIMPN